MSSPCYPMSILINTIEHVKHYLLNDEDTFFQKFILFIADKKYDKLMILLDEHFNEKIPLFPKINSSEYSFYILDIIHESFGKDNGLQIIEKLCHMLDEKEIEIMLLENMHFKCHIEFYLLIVDKMKYVDDKIMLRLFQVAMWENHIENLKKVMSVFSFDKIKTHIQAILYSCSSDYIFSVIKFFIENNYEIEFKKSYTDHKDIYVGLLVLRKILHAELNISKKEPSDFFRHMCVEKFSFMKIFQEYELELLLKISPKHAELILEHYRFLTGKFTSMIPQISNPDFNSDDYLNFIKKLLTKNKLVFDNNYPIICRFPKLFSYAVEKKKIDLNKMLWYFIKTDYLENIPYIDYFLDNRCVYEEKFEDEKCSPIELKKLKTFLSNEDFKERLNNTIQNYCKFYENSNPGYMNFIAILVDNYLMIEDNDNIMCIIRKHLKENFLKNLEYKQHDLFKNSILIKLLFEHDTINVRDMIIDLKSFVTHEMYAKTIILDKAYKIYPEKFNNLDTIYLNVTDKIAISKCEQFMIPFEIIQNY